LRAATASARQAPRDSPTRYIGLLGERWFSDLTVLSTSFTSPEPWKLPSTYMHKEIQPGIQNLMSVTQLCIKLVTGQDKRGPRKDVLSLTGICKHHMSKILVSMSKTRHPDQYHH
jgi:hypothetical protein